MCSRPTGSSGSSLLSRLAGGPGGAVARASGGGTGEHRRAGALVGRRSRRRGRCSDRARACGPDHEARRRLPGHDGAVSTIRACVLSPSAAGAAARLARRWWRVVLAVVGVRLWRSRPRPRMALIDRLPSSSCRRSPPRRTPLEARSASTCRAPAPPSRVNGRSPPSSAAGSSRRSSRSTARPRCGSRTPQPGRRSTSPCRRRDLTTTSCGTPWRSSGRAIAACSRRTRRGSAVSSRSRISRRPRRRSPPVGRRRFGRAQTPMPLRR